MFDAALDERVRAAAFGWLAGQKAVHGDVLPRSVLAEGFQFGGERVPLISPQGIFKPRILYDVPLSITTAPNGPYNDTFSDKNGLLRYCYRGTDPGHPDNRGLRNAMLRQLPLVYFHGLVPGRYMAVWPVYIVGDNRDDLTFSVAVDDADYASGVAAFTGQSDRSPDQRNEIRREYVTRMTRGRLHQKAFRERVLQAYQQQCAFCRFRHAELLEASHIIPDSDPEGESVVPNGLALCTLHHAAFDRAFLGLRPDYIIEVRPDILRERDGPTLAHAIQALHGTRIVIPSSQSLRPDPDRLEVRYQQFLESYSSAYKKL